MREARERTVFLSAPQAYKSRYSRNIPELMPLCDLRTIPNKGLWEALRPCRLPVFFEVVGLPRLAIIPQ